jgi:hypothetical protein
VTAPLIDYARYRAAYTHGHRGFRAPMGSFKTGLLSPAGLRVRALLTQYVGRPPRFQGAARGSVYFKWLVKDPDEPTRLRIAADEVRDLGYDVAVAESANRNRADEAYVKLTVRWQGGAR